MPLSATPLSAAMLRDALRGRRLNEGAARVLKKLESGAGSGLRRVYTRMGSSVMLSDLASDEWLASSGYIATRHCCSVQSHDALKCDRIAYWISELDAAELWVGEPLAD
ncbi:MAG TPA: hypothetical protein VII75_14460 [Thermoanaerobaculia bacterium]|jgi:hypothetical protein|nr:hypothetical protein [Thermoanaerobaculia bacterium]